MATWNMHRSPNEVSWSKPQEEIWGIRGIKTNRIWLNKKKKKRRLRFFLSWSPHLLFISDGKVNRDNWAQAYIRLFSQYLSSWKQQWTPEKGFDQALNFFTSFIYFFYMIHSQSFKQIILFVRKVGTFPNVLLCSVLNSADTAADALSSEDIFR